MSKLRDFIEQELETRRTSFLPTNDSEDAAYIKQAEEALAECGRLEDRIPDAETLQAAIECLDAEEREAGRNARLYGELDREKRYQADAERYRTAREKLEALQATDKSHAN